MKNIYSNIKKINKKSIFNTVNYLKKNNIVGLPTETVYGIAGNAYSKKALKSIYKLKKRPKKNPLIIHYLNIKNVGRDAILNKNFLRLYKHFCPGPITFILKKNKKSKIDKLATANLSTVAIRFPKHKIIRAILKVLDFPLAMPSANLSSSLSPINALDVYDEFKNKLKIIINGGSCKIGIESTVVDLTQKPKILRPGIIGSSEIKKYISVNLSKKKSKLKSPGMLKKHYSPGIPVIMGKMPISSKHAYIIFGKKFAKNGNYFNLSKKGSLKEAAANLYKTMRKIKKNGYKKIYVTKIPNKGLGLAINDRLKRASN